MIYPNSIIDNPFTPTSIKQHSMQTFISLATEYSSLSPPLRFIIRHHTFFQFDNKLRLPNRATIYNPSTDAKHNTCAHPRELTHSHRIHVSIFNLPRSSHSSLIQLVVVATHKDVSGWVDRRRLSL